MPIGERDPHTGHMTTGHEWNGITELNRPVPKAIWFFLIATALFSFVYWVLMPAWPLGVTYTHGLLGVDQRTTVAQRLAEAESARADWERRIEAAPFAEIQADETLMHLVRRTGRTLFGDNCAVCHRLDGLGTRGYPNLVVGAWAWGGNPETIAETLRVGVNANHPETRVSQMPAFGRDGVLDRQQILNVVAYVQSLSGSGTAEGRNAGATAAGAEVFAANCASCHGERGQGNPELGAPNLTDGFWLHGGDLQSLYSSVSGGRQGHMPYWEGRLTPVERKILALYVVEFGLSGE